MENLAGSARRGWGVLAALGLAAAARRLKSKFEGESVLWQRDGTRGTDEPLKLSLDEAIRRGFETNLGLKEAESGEKLYRAKRTSRCRSSCPRSSWRGARSLSTQPSGTGFGPGCSRQFGSLFPTACRPGFADYEGRLDAGPADLQADAVFGCGDCGMEGGGSCEAICLLREDVARGEVVQQVARRICMRLRMRARWITPRRC